jgi:hypothetical protein
MTTGRRLGCIAAAALGFFGWALFPRPLARVVDHATGVAEAFACQVAPATQLDTAAARGAPKAIPARPVTRPGPAISVDAWNERINRLSAVFPRTERGDLSKLDLFCLADFDRDDQVTAQDLTAFMDTWTRGDDVTGYLADLNHDGVLDQQDVDVYFDAYFKNDCDTKETANVRSYSC